MEQSDYYSILQVDLKASQDEVREAYRRLAFLCHPDQSQNPQATQEMQRLNEAYDILGDQEKRTRYDLERIIPEVEVPIQPSQPAEAQTRADQEGLKNRLRQRMTWIQSRLKVIGQLIILLVVLFLWSLATGQVNGILILGFVLLSVYVIVSTVIRFRRLVE